MRKQVAIRPASERSNRAAGADGRLIAGRYELIKETGRDHTGAAYKGRHTVRDSPCTVILLPEQLTRDPAALARVERAVRKVSALQHEHIVPLSDFGRDADRFYLVEDFVGGEPLDRVLSDGHPLSPADILRLAGQLADALAHAHDRGVVHGAIAPANIVIDRSASPRAMLSGFVKAALSADQPLPPSALLPYAAPERLLARENREDHDARIDIFALGVLIYEMFERKPFFSTMAEDELIDLLQRGRTPLVPRFSRIVPAGVSGLVARSIRRSPGERHPSMAHVRLDIAAALERLEQNVGEDAVRVLAESPAPAPPTVTSAPRPKVRVAVGALGSPIPRRVLVRASGKRPAARRRTSLALGALVVAGVLASGALLLRPATSPPAASDRGTIDPSPTADVRERGTAAPGEVQPEHETALAPPVAVVDADAAAPAPPASDTDVARGHGVIHARGVAAPRIVGYQPRHQGRLDVLERESLAFGVRAAAEDPDAQLAYDWFLDGRRVGRRQAWRFMAPPAATGTVHRVEVRVSRDGAAKTARMSWRVEVSPRMTELNVHDWLDRLAGAWERKDVATLRLFGIVQGDAETEALRTRLSRYRGYRVAIANETIRTHGSRATVSFDLTELEGRGKTITSRRESYVLAKQPSGFIGLRSAE